MSISATLILLLLLFFQWSEALPGLASCRRFLLATALAGLAFCRKWPTKPRSAAWHHLANDALLVNWFQARFYQHSHFSTNPRAIYPRFSSLCSFFFVYLPSCLLSFYSPASSSVATSSGPSRRRATGDNLRVCKCGSSCWPQVSQSVWLLSPYLGANLSSLVLHRCRQVCLLAETRWLSTLSSWSSPDYRGCVASLNDKKCSENGPHKLNRPVCECLFRKSPILLLVFLQQHFINSSAV